jgi:cystathionine beta-lyase
MYLLAFHGAHSRHYTMKKDTQLIHHGRNPKKHFGTVNPPIFQSSTVIFPDLEAYNKAENGEHYYEDIFNTSSPDPSYGISGMPTTNALQDVLRTLENGHYCLITPSGLAAINLALMAFLEAGDHLLITDSVYGPVRRFCNKVLKKMGVEVTYYKASATKSELEPLVQPNTKVLYLEVPGTFTFEIQDVEGLVQLAKEKDLVTMADNSWASPLYFNPLDWGIDISLHAITKFISGHSDLLLGAAITNEKTTARMCAAFKNFGYNTSAYDCSLALRGIRTMHARMSYQQGSVKKVVDYLKTVPQVKKILFPADEASEYYASYKKYFKGAASLFSVILDKEYSAQSLGKMVDGYELFGIGASWGGFESLVKDFDIRSSRVAEKWQPEGSCLRYYIGLENPDDIIEDLKQGFARLK